MTERRRPALIILLIILSLILHIGFLILFFLIKPPEHTQLMPSITFEEPPAPINYAQPEPDPTGVASLKPRASNFGDPTTENQETQNAKNSFSKEQIDAKDLESEEEKEENSPDDEQKSLEQAEENNEIVKTTDTESMTQLIMNETQNSEPLTRPLQKKRHRVKQQQVPSQIYGADVQTRSITFADIAQGFIHSIKNEGEDWLKRDGDDSKRPDPIEMRYISYIQKVVWYLQNSFRQSEPKSWPTTQAAVSFKITLDREGEIHHIEMMKASGNDLLDAFIRKRIEKAGPFPPLPDHFKRHHFQILLSFTVGDQRMPIIHGSIACM
ncbi:TonB C-terminal domain-containing protein [Candidatus Dependentiae bacterium]|nr:TonB C-terminal domain-containing protein [Candidatus Dependentiae bacterium]